MSITRRKQLEELRTHLLQLRKELELQKNRLGQLLPPMLEQNLSEVYNSLEKTDSELARLPPSEAITLVCCPPEREIPSFAQQIRFDCCQSYVSHTSSPEFWKKQFWNELLPLCQQIQAHANNNLALFVHAPLSVSVALGYLAQSLANTPIWIEMGGMWWQHSMSEKEIKLLSVQLAQQVHHERCCLSIEIDLLPQTDCSSFLSDKVTDTINHLNLPIATRLQLRLQQNQALENTWQFQALSSQLQALFAKIRQTHVENPIHLFIASSSSIAVSIGCNLVGFEPFQCYEFSSEQQHFLPTCMIDPVSYVLKS